MKDVEIIGILKAYVKKAINAITVTTVNVTQNITTGNELAEIEVNGTPTKVYMPSVSVNGVEQSVTDNGLDLDVASNVITPAQWTSITSILQ